jgi:hypothetical protein
LLGLAKRTAAQAKLGWSSGRNFAFLLRSPCPTLSHICGKGSDNNEFNNGEMNPVSYNQNERSTDKRLQSLKITGKSKMSSPSSMRFSVEIPKEKLEKLST